MKISLIAAISKNLIIGNKNTIPWKLPNDLLWFKKNTINKSIIMGRLTWESIGIPLPMRQNIIISRKPINHIGIIHANSINEAIKIANKEKEIMVIGGGSVYTQMLPLANKLYLTHLNLIVSGDTYFPNYLKYSWKNIFNKHYPINQKNHYFDYRFEILRKINYTSVNK